VISRRKSPPPNNNYYITSANTMPTEPKKTDPTKTTKKVDDKKPAEYHNFLKIDHSLRPAGFHCQENNATK
jgi:hypothetical protein